MNDTKFRRETLLKSLRIKNKEKYERKPETSFITKFVLKVLVVYKRKI